MISVGFAIPIRAIHVSFGLGYIHKHVARKAFQTNPQSSPRLTHQLDEKLHIHLINYQTMVSLRTVLVALAGIRAVFAAPTPATTDLAVRAPSELAKRLTVTTSTTGTSGNYYYSCYIESNTGATMTIGTGTYSLTWTASSTDVVAGIGWATGAAR